MDIINWLYLGIPILFGLLLALFIYQTRLRQRRVPFLVSSLVFGLFAGLFGFLDGAGWVDHYIGIVMQLNLSGFQIFFFYLFIEALSDVRIGVAKFAFAFCLLVMQTLSLWSFFWMHALGVSDFDSQVWFFADFGYGMQALFVYLGLGVYFYLKVFRLTKEVKALLLAIALMLVSVSFLVSFTKDMTDFAHIPLPNWYDDLSTVAQGLVLVGLTFFTVVYLVDIDYLYRLPFDIYQLQVAYKTGITIHSVKFKARSSIELEEDLLSGLLSTINSVFQAIVKEGESGINTISGKKMHILIESGQKISIIVPCERPSIILVRAMRRYVAEFERMFSVRIGDNDTLVNDFDSARVLLKKIFPFLIPVENVAKIEK